MSFSTESIRNRHRPGIRVIDTREYSGPAKGGTRRLFDDRDVLKDARLHKFQQSGGKNPDGLELGEFI